MIAWLLYSMSKSGGTASLTDTTLDGKQAVGIMGDSIALGSTTTGKGTTPAANTVFEYNGTSIVSVGSNDLSTSSTGSQYPQLGIDYYNATGKKLCYINTAVGGAEYSPNGDTNNWSTSGVNYTSAKTKITNGLGALGLTKLKFIVVILGINDARGSITLTTVQSDVDSFYSRLNTDFPGIPKYLVQIGRSETAISNTRIDAVRGYINTNISTYADCHLAFDLRTYAQSFPSYYGPDNLHLNITGCNALGTDLATYILNPT